MLLRRMKENNKRGFTLAELLVVVAIIAILVAVSIPIFTGKLNEARQNTDLANERAAKAAAISAYLSDETSLKDKKEYYDAENGTLVPATGVGSNFKKYGKYGEHKGQFIKVVINENAADGEKNPTVTVTWTDKAE